MYISTTKQTVDNNIWSVKWGGIPCHQEWQGQSKVPVLPSTPARYQRTPGRRDTQTYQHIELNALEKKGCWLWLQAKTQKDTVPSPLSCLVNRRSSGHSWGRLGLCTRLCETVARCRSALQIPCVQTTAAAGRQNKQVKQSVLFFNQVCWAKSLWGLWKRAG